MDFRCPRCDNPHDVGQSECHVCGQVLASPADPCDRCGVVPDPGDAYCGNCGNELRGAANPAGAVRSDNRDPNNLAQRIYGSSGRGASGAGSPPAAGGAPALPLASRRDPTAATSGRDGVLVGTVRDKEESKQPGRTPVIADRNYRPPDDTVVTFRIERLDKSGDRLPPVQVEMRSAHFTGRISNGDSVEVPGTWCSGQVLRTDVVYNRTTRSTFQAVADTNREIGKSILAVVFIGLLVFGVLQLLG